MSPERIALDVMGGDHAPRSTLDGLVAACDPAGASKLDPERVKAKALFVIAEQDHMVSPIPGRAFAKAMGGSAKLVVLDGPCGHIAPTCEAAKLAQAVAPFLAD